MVRDAVALGRRGVLAVSRNVAADPSFGASSDSMRKLSNSSSKAKP
jgi:hypothetical protein